MTYRMLCKEQNGPSRSVDAVDLSPCKLKKRRSFRFRNLIFTVTSSRIPEVKKKLTFGVLALCCLVLIDCVEFRMTEKGYRYGVSFAAKNEAELEERAFLCRQKRQRTRDPPLGSCTCRARRLVPIPVQNGARVSCKWRIESELVVYTSVRLYLRPSLTLTMCKSTLKLVCSLRPLNVFILNDVRSPFCNSSS